MQPIFETCVPREDVIAGRLRDEEFAAELAKVVNGTATPEYGDPSVFFRHTHPTHGIKQLLATVCQRLTDAGGELNSVIRLDTQFGGGKTHGLISLVHAVRGMEGVEHAAEFVDPDLIPKGKVRIAAIDGENSDPANGLTLESGLRAHSLWGEMAYRLAGREGYERVRKSDEKHVAPGTETIIELFGGEPSLILIDEIAVYLRKVAKVYPDATNQFTAFVQSLVQAVAATPRVALVFTLAVRNEDRKASDAYQAEQQIALSAFEEAERVAGRKSTQLNPTQESETAFVLKRRLFESIDDNAAEPVIEGYRDLWRKHEESLSEDAGHGETLEQLRAGFPLHPETLNVLLEKTSSLSTFQRTRGMLRLLARTVQHLWQTRPADAVTIHPHHIDPAFQPTRDELTARLNQGAFAPVITADVAAVEGTAPATAQHIDATEYAGQPPVASYVARTILLHTLAYGDAAKGATADRLRFSVASPMVEPAFVESARKRFIQESLYLDDRPGAPLRFMTEPNLTQMIRKATNEIDPDHARSYLQERIRDLFSSRGQPFEMVPFPGEPYEIPDEIGDGRPYLVVLGYDAFCVSSEPDSLPPDIVAMATTRGHNREYRTFQNNLVFVVADDRLRENMKQVVRWRLGLGRLQEADRIRDLADYQQEEVKERYRKSDLDLSIAVLQAYRHLFYPSHMPLSSQASLAHTVVDIPSTSDNPGNGQRFVRRALRDQKKILDAGDSPDAPAFVRDQTPLKTKGTLTTLELRNEFRRSPKLSILLSDELITACIRQGIEHDVFIYREGEQVWGKGDPNPSIQIGDNAFVHTVQNAKEHGLWPRKPAEPEQPAETPPTSTGGETPPPPGPPPGPPPPTPGPGPAPEPTPAADLSAEGPLRQALTSLFEKARAADIDRLAEITIQLFEPGHTWKVHQGVATFKGSKVTCHFTAGVVADGIETFHLDFKGNMAKANNIKSFLDPLIRSAEDSDFIGRYQLAFDEPLSTAAEPSETFIKAITKYGGGEAYVEARAAADKDA